ncbi:MAG TPA: exonuclease domain-containing protein [Lachnospiraceae bacterium]
MQREWIVLDLETTGLHPKNDKIIEIGAIKIKEDRIADSFCTFVNPHRKLSGQVEDLTHISTQMLEDAPSIEDVLGNFVDFCEDYPLLGHNILFDYSFMKHATVNAGLCFEKKALDTLKIARVLHKDLDSRSLESLCRHYGIVQEYAHRALDDAKNTYFLYKKLKEKFYAENESLFQPKELLYKPKKQSPITAAQKGYLKDLLKYHKITCDIEIEKLSKSEASRKIDKIILEYGKIERKFL